MKLQVFHFHICNHCFDVENSRNALGIMTGRECYLAGLFISVWDWFIPHKSYTFCLLKFCSKTLFVKLSYWKYGSVAPKWDNCNDFPFLDCRYNCCCCELYKHHTFSFRWIKVYSSKNAKLNLSHLISFN